MKTTVSQLGARHWLYGGGRRKGPLEQVTMACARARRAALPGADCARIDADQLGKQALAQPECQAPMPKADGPLPRPRAPLTTIPATIR